MSALKSIRDDLNYGLAAFGVQIPERVSLDDWAHKLTEHPAQNTAALLSAATVLFYLAERGHNPRVRDIYDAMVYCTTNISVGYCDIFAHTPTGKLIGSALMTIGPAMAAKTLDGAKPPADASAATAQTQEQILATLREILAKLQPAPTAPPPPAASEGSNGHG
jgi:hypothetical protein